MTGERIVTLDILRGVAVMGILAMNAIAFAMPFAAYPNPEAYGGSTGADLYAWATAYLFVDGKMRGLFSVLFGASMLLVIEGARAKGEGGAAVHFRRMAVLLAFGVVHYYLIWWGDILTLYAMVGALAFLWSRARTRTLVLWFTLFFLLSAALAVGAGYAFLEASAAASRPGASAEAVRTWSEMGAAFGPPSGDVLARDLALHRGPWSDLVAHRTVAKGSGPVDTLAFFGLETLAYMLLGMIGYRAGFLTGGWPDQTYGRVALAFALSGAVAYAFLGDWMTGSGFEPATVFAATIGATTIPRTLMIVGYAAMIILITRNGGWLVQRIAAAGRMAFSNYLGTSLVMTTLFYGYGLGLYGQVGRAELYLYVIALWGLILLWSKPWLERFRYGPLEWLWRSLARGRAQPMRHAFA